MINFPQLLNQTYLLFYILLSKKALQIHIFVILSLYWLLFSNHNTNIYQTSFMLRKIFSYLDIHIKMYQHTLLKVSHL